MPVSISTLGGPQGPAGGVGPAGPGAIVPTVIGAALLQTAAEVGFQVFATTVNAAAVTLDTIYTPIANHAAKVKGSLSAVDRTSFKCTALDVEAVLRNFAAILTVAGVGVVNVVGDAALVGATIVLGVSVGQSLTVTFTPPPGYVGTIEWLLVLDMMEN